MRVPLWGLGALDVICAVGTALSTSSHPQSMPVMSGVPSTPRGTGDSRKSCVTPELCTIAISASHRGTCPQERRESRESATPSSSQFGRKLSSQPRFSSPRSSSTPPRLRQTAPAATPCLGSAQLPQQPSHAAREISYVQSQTHSLASLNPSSRRLQNRPHGAAPTRSGPPRQQRLLPGSRGGSGFFTTFERQTLEAAPWRQSRSSGCLQGGRHPPGKPKPRQTQTPASCLRRTEPGLQTQRAPATPPPQSPNKSFSSNKRAGGSVPFARQHSELNFPRIVSHHARGRRVGTGKEGRCRRKQRGPEPLTFPRPRASSGTTDSVSPPPPGRMCHESRRVRPGSSLLRWHTGRSRTPPSPRCPSPRAPPQPQRVLPLGEPRERAALARIGKTAPSKSLQGKTHIPQAISMKIEDRAHPAMPSCSFSKAAPLCSGSALTSGAPAALAGSVFLFAHAFRSHPIHLGSRQSSARRVLRLRGNHPSAHLLQQDPQERAPRPTPLQGSPLGSCLHHGG